MKWYAETPPVRARQLVLDLLVLIWVVFFARLGVRVHDTVLGLREPGARLEDAGNSLAGSFDSAADRIDGAPVVGGRLRAPFDAAANAGRDVANAGVSGQHAIERLALILGLVVALV
ncbi:MAG: hypothetical protein JWL64_436, partial [Frankiales bacterium]|nr:hypothetical protein [Frankiales bacterium]